MLPWIYYGKFGGNIMNKKYFTENRPVLLLIALNVLLFIALNFSSNISNLLLLSPDVTTALQKPWTLLTVFFSHTIPIHIVLNMFLILIFGTELYKTTNALVFYSAYILNGFLGSLSILIYAPLIGYEGELIAGASAAAFGVVATYVILKPNEMVLKSKSKFWLIAIFIVNAILTIQNPKVSVGGPAHAIGILGGLAFGYILKITIFKENSNETSKV